MKRGPKPRWCYVCQKPAPCSSLAPCNRLDKKSKAVAYQVGYVAKHGAKLRLDHARRYRRGHPNAEPYKPQLERNAEALAGGPTPAARVALRGKAKRRLAGKNARRRADQEAD